MPSTIQWKTLSRGLPTTTECPLLFPCLARNPCPHRSPTKFEDGMGHLLSLSSSLILLHTPYVRSFTVTIYLSVCHTSLCSPHHLSSLFSRSCNLRLWSFAVLALSFELGIASAEPASPSKYTTPAYTLFSFNCTTMPYSIQHIL